jgi:hypothetical protein
VSEPKDLSAYHRLMRAAQRYARVFATPPRGAAPRASEGEQREKPAGTAVARLRHALAEAEDALTSDLVALATAAMDEARRERERIANELSEREREWRDTAKVRDALAKAAAGWDWRIEHKDRRDFIGPFTLEHAPGHVKLLLGRIRLKALDHPSGEEVFAEVQTERKRLETAARSEWPSIRAALLDRQRAPDDVVPWRELAAALSPGAPLRKREPAVILALALVREGSLEPGWALSTRPPSLAHQKDALTLPRIDRPGSPDKIYALRIDRASP